jgi:hypothetical protein
LIKITAIVEVMVMKRTLLVMSCLLFVVNAEAETFIMCVDDPGVILSGNWVAYDGGYSGNEHYQSSPGNNATCTWEFSSLPSATYYAFSTWTPMWNRTPVATYEISDGGGVAIINQQLTPDDIRLEGGTWESLGSVTINDGTLTITVSDDDPDGFLMADAVLITTNPKTFYGNGVVILDDGDDGYNLEGVWGTTAEGLFFDYRWQYEPGNGATAICEFTNLPDGWYQVSATWPDGVDGIDPALYTVEGIGIEVNQTELDADMSDVWGGWINLAVVYVHDGTLQVVISEPDTPDNGGYLIADGVRIERFGKATDPIPADGAEGVLINADLQWKAGEDPNNPGQPLPDISGFMVYYGTDQEEVSDATTNSSVYYGYQSITGNEYQNFNPEVDFEKDLTYYWRIDSVLNLPGPTNDPNYLLSGDVWTFDSERSLPIIDKQPLNSYVWPGDTANFTIVATNPMPGELNYQWYEGVTPDTSTPVGTDSATLSILGSIGDSYYCRVTNTSGSVDSEPAYIREKKLIAHWTMDDVSEPDSIIAGSPSTTAVGGPQNDPDGVSLLNGAIAFDGTNDYLVQDAGDYYDLMDDACTISCWVKHHGAGSLVAKRGWAQGWFVYVDADGIVSFNTYGLSNVTLAAPYFAIDSDWHLVTATFDGAVKKLYIDAQLVADQEVDHDSISTIAESLRIGAQAYETYDPWDFFDGSIDDVRLYIGSLEATELAQLYFDGTANAACLDRPLSDISGDCMSNIEDLALLASEWLECGLYPSSQCP